MEASHFYQTDAWDLLQQYTSARIARGRTGHSVPTQTLLAFQADHAQARDAVYSTLATEAIQQALVLPSLVVASRALHRMQYLQRPDLGRRLNEESRVWLNDEPKTFDICFVIADGLSAQAVNQHAVPVVNEMCAFLQKKQWKIAPLVLVKQGRVAIGDEIASALHATIVVVLIGERPGLSSADSMGAYLTYAPAIGITDERRNCISNIRPEGLPYQLAVEKMMYLLMKMNTLHISGVALKDDLEGRFLIE